MNLKWEDFKTFCSSRSVSMHELRLGSDYLLVAFDGPLSVQSKLSAESTEALDYETNFQSTANLSFTDSSGTPLARARVTKTGWHAQPHFIEFETSSSGSVFNQDKDLNDLGFTSIKFYDSSNVELVTQQDIDTSCVKTVIDWEPTHDYGLLGGEVRQHTATTENIRMWVTAFPDAAAFGYIPVEFIEGGANLRYASSNPIIVDGKAQKELLYTPGVGSNKIRFTIRHPAGIKHCISVELSIFKPGA